MVPNADIVTSNTLLQSERDVRQVWVADQTAAPVDARLEVKEVQQRSFEDRGTVTVKWFTFNPRLNID